MILHRFGLAVTLGAVCLTSPIFGVDALAQSASPIIPGGAAKGPVSINAPSLDYLDKEHKLVYSGGVVAKQGEATLKAASLTILLNDSSSAASAVTGEVNAAGGNQIHRIEAAGPVSIVSKNQVGTGDSGVYDRPTNKLTLSGNVTLSQCGNVLKGARLVYDLTSGRAQVLGGVTSLFTPGVSCDEPGKGRAAPEKPQKPATSEPRPRR
jgi:lipopolysaccharide export system protein LptA